MNYPEESFGPGGCVYSADDNKRTRYAVTYNEIIAEYLRSLSSNIPLEDDGKVAPQLGR